MCVNAPAWITAGATVIYTVITIWILFANRKSAKAAKGQIEELKKQTVVNIGLQLYEKRVNALETAISIPERSFDKYHCKQLDLDIALLFDDEIQSEYKNLKSHSVAFRSLISPELFKAELKEKSPEIASKINEFEQRIGNGYGEQVHYEYEELCKKGIQVGDDQELSYEEIKQEYESAENKLKAVKDSFIGNMEDYIRSSISN